MIMASDGSGGRFSFDLTPAGWAASAPCFPCSKERMISVSPTRAPRFFQGDHKTAIGHRPANRRIAAGRQAQAPLKAALRQLQPVDRCRPQRSGKLSAAGDDEVAAVDCCLATLGADPLQ